MIRPFMQLLIFVLQSCCCYYYVTAQGVGEDSSFFDSLVDNNSNKAPQEEESSPSGAPTVSLYDPDVSTLTDSQEVVLSVLSLVTGTLSFIGSFVIVYRVYKKHRGSKLLSSVNMPVSPAPPAAAAAAAVGGGERNKSSNSKKKCKTRQQTSSSASLSLLNTTTPYDRIMLGLSICDMISSFTWAITPFLLPEDTSTRVWAKGNTQTCTFLGMLTQFSFASVWYNGMLSFYYLLTVRFGVKRDVFRRRYEPFVHITTIGYFGITALVGVFIHLYSELEVTQGCWIGEYPEGCEARGDCVSTLIGWIYGGLPFVFTFLSLPINNIMIYCYTRKQLLLLSSSSTTTTTTTDPPGSNQPGPSIDNVTTAPTSNTTTNTRPTLVSSSSIGSINSTISTRTNRSTRTTTTTRTLTQQNARRIREVATQGFLYVFSFYVCYTPAFIIRVLEGMGLDGEKESEIYPVLVLNSLLLPFQGFFNVFIYTRPNYVRVQAAYPNQPKWWVMKHACLESEIPRLGNSQIVSGGNNTNNKENNNNNSNDKTPGGNNGANSGSGGSTDGEGGGEGGGVGGGIRASSSRAYSAGSTCFYGSELDIIPEDMIGSSCSENSDHFRQPSASEAATGEKKGNNIDDLVVTEEPSSNGDDDDDNDNDGVGVGVTTSISTDKNNKVAYNHQPSKKNSSFRMLRMDGSLQDDSDHDFK